MRIVLKNIIRSWTIFLCPALAMLMIIGVTGCVDDLLMLQGQMEEPSETYSVSIALAGMGAEITRGIGEDSEDTDGVLGSEEENFINIDDLYVMTFSIEGDTKVLSEESKLIEVLWNGKRENTSSKNSIYCNGTAVFLNASLDRKKYSKDKDFCIVAIANISQFAKTDGKDLSLANDMTFGSLQQQLKYNFTPNIQDKDNNCFWLPYTEINGQKTKQGIPLFGVKRVNLKNYDPTIYNFANPFTLISNGNPTLWMLRAFSKIEIELSDNISDKDLSGKINISSACVNNNYASAFWVIPELERMSGFYETSGKQPGTGGTGQIDKVPGDGFRSSKNETNQPMQFKIDSQRKSGVIYLPEYYINDNSVRPEITLNLNIGEESKTLNFYIQQYNNNISGQPLNTLYPWQYLIRNHNYKFMIGINSNQILSVTSDEWGDVYENEFTFGEKPNNDNENQNNEE